MPLFNTPVRLTVAWLFFFLTAACNGRPATAKIESSLVDNNTQTASYNHLRVMTYNVLKYGDGCQEKIENLHQELKTIIDYTSPDILGLIKVAAPAGVGNDHHAQTNTGFPQEILQKALNAAYPRRYAACPATNTAGANNINLLFYDTAKLGYTGMQTLVSNATDFNLYRLYLKKSLLSGHDTTFLYVVLNHTESGDDATERSHQLEAVAQAIKKAFPQLPNMIDMGDFNMRNTSEPGYHNLVASANAAYQFADPPFSLDKTIKYPADWETNPEPFSKYLTTSTRKTDGKPNDCGTGGAAKFWYDHILLSPKIANGTDGLSYVRNSYRTIGNDGNRIGHAVNAGKHPNKDVPEKVAEALFRFSNKYPVLVELED